MKRRLIFDITDDSYAIFENEECIFEIPFKNLRFDSRAFYQGLYANGKSSIIEIENKVRNNQKASYVFEWLCEIIQEISEELGEADNEGILDEGNSLPNMKVVTLFDMAVCAGGGDFIEVQNSSGEDFETDNLDADYALRISGNSMEPTLKDGDIVLVKEIETPDENQIIIVNVDGNSMIKRYCIDNGKAFLAPDNKCGDYSGIAIDENKSIRVQGQVIEIIKNEQ